MARLSLLTLTACLLSRLASGKNISAAGDDTEERFLQGAFSPWAGQDCTTGLSDGVCVPLRYCAALRAQVRNVHPGRILQHLEDYTFPCFIQGQVCCPSDRRQNQSPGQERPWQQKNENNYWTWPDVDLKPTPPKWQPQPSFTSRPTPPTDPTTPPPAVVPPKRNRPRPGKQPSKKLPNKGSVQVPPGVKTQHRNRGLLPGNCGVHLGHRVLGGQETGLAEHPWLALLRMRIPSGRTAYVCGGSIIASRYVLTAAHCMKGAGIPRGGTVDSVRIGEHNVDQKEDCAEGKCNSPPQDIEVERMIVHPNFTPEDPGTFNDIALLRLKADIKFNFNIQPVCLPLDALAVAKYDGRKLTTVGWGRTSNDAKSSNSPAKQKVNVPVVPFSDCAPMYRSRKIILRDTQICAGGEEGKDSCQGDSGGPLMSQDTVEGELRWIVQGIVSTGPKECGQANAPAIYTRVTKFLPWILDNMRA